MRILSLIFLICLLILPAAAQSPSATVAVDSAFMRSAPAESAELAGSGYEGEILRVVGRSADGLWLNVHRPPTPARTAWIRRDLVTFSADLTLLPLTDFVTGVTGPEPLYDTGFAALLTGEAQLRAFPDRFAPSNGVMPVGVVVPILERTPNNFWLKVNYLGTVGWIAEFTSTTAAAFADIPVAPELAGDPAFAAIEIVDPVLQVAQIDRLLAYLGPAYATADSVSLYWQQILRGDTRECLPPADVQPFPVSAADKLELPELRRQTSLLDQALEDINVSIAAMHRCGVYVNREVNAAYSSALAARGTYNLLIRRMITLRELLTGEEYGDD